jgi:hypothetical protein
MPFFLTSLYVLSQEGSGRREDGKEVREDIKTIEGGNFFLIFK